MLSVPKNKSRNDLALMSQKSSEGIGQFEKNVSPFEIAKKLNPRLCEDEEACAHMDHLIYDENDVRISSSHEAPTAIEESNLKRR